MLFMPGIAAGGAAPAGTTLTGGMWAGARPIVVAIRLIMPCIPCTSRKPAGWGPGARGRCPTVGSRAATYPRK